MLLLDSRGLWLRDLYIGMEISRSLSFGVKGKELIPFFHSGKHDFWLTGKGCYTVLVCPCHHKMHGCCTYSIKFRCSSIWMICWCVLHRRAWHGAHLAALGLSLNDTKRSGKYLGLFLDSVTMKACLTQKRRMAIMECFRSYSSCRTVSVAQGQWMLGLRSSFPGCATGPVAHTSSPDLVLRPKSLPSRSNVKNTYPVPWRHQG